MRIHPLIVVLVHPGDDRLPPTLVIEIPCDRLFDAIGKSRLWKPSQFVVDLRRINSIAHIMTLAIRYISDKAFRLSQLMADLSDDVYVRFICFQASGPPIDWKAKLTAGFLRLQLFGHLCYLYALEICCIPCGKWPSSPHYYPVFLLFKYTIKVPKAQHSIQHSIWHMDISTLFITK